MAFIVQIVSQIMNLKATHRHLTPSFAMMISAII